VRVAAIIGGLGITIAGYGFGVLSVERRRVVQQRAEPGPCKVITLDVDEPAPAIASVRLGAEPYAAVRILAVRRGVPLATVELPFRRPTLTGDDVALALPCR
jgi:hypothetical protein